MIDVVNLQRKTKIDVARLRKFVAALQATVNEAAEKAFSVAFISDRRMRELNSLFRGSDTSTDVLAFPHEPDEFDPDKNNLGDIVISAEQAEKQASENGLDLEAEIKQLILHGLLHLCGYDHTADTGQMDSRELELRASLGIRGPA